MLRNFVLAPTWQVKGNSEEIRATLINEALENTLGQGIDISSSLSFLELWLREEGGTGRQGMGFI